MKHAQTPWRWRSSNDFEATIEAADGEIIASVNLIHESKHGDANLDLILRAVNNHDGLLAALKDIANGNNVPDKMLELGPVEFQKWFAGHLQKMARTAIERAEGGK